MRTAGLDIATCTGMAYVNDLGEIIGKTASLPKEKRSYRKLQSIAKDVARTLDVWRPELVAIEGYGHPGRSGLHSLIVLVEMGTLIRIALLDLGIPWVELPSTVLKKWTTGKGNADKAQMAVSVKSRWGFESPSHDIVDAVALAQVAQMGLPDILALPGAFLGPSESVSA